MSPAPLTVDVYVAPMRPFAGAAGQGEGDKPMWSPMSSTLIAGAEEGILVDTLVTLDQVEASFPGELPETPVLPEVLDGEEYELEGQVLRVVSVGQGDTEFSTVLHVPSAAAVVGGDVVYNGVHMMTAETDEKSREAWIASLDAVAALNPQIVVAGHKSVGAPDLPESIGASQRYLSDFTRIVGQGGSVQEVVNAMLELHGDRDNPRTLWHSARTAVAKRDQAG